MQKVSWVLGFGLYLAEDRRPKGWLQTTRKAARAALLYPTKLRRSSIAGNSTSYRRYKHPASCKALVCGAVKLQDHNLKYAAELQKS